MRPNCGPSSTIWLEHSQELGGLPGLGHYPDPGPRRARAYRKGLFAGQVSFWRNVSKTEWVYGFKVALVVDPDGKVSAFGLAPANCDERPIGDTLIAQDRHDIYPADKGFSSAEREWHWLETYGVLVAVTPKNNSKRAWSKVDRRWASGKRQLIEGGIDQLKISSPWNAIRRRPC